MCSGVLVGIMLPMIFGILSEYLPIKYRGFTLIVVWCFYGIGGLYVNLTMKILMPLLQAEETNVVIRWLTLPYALFAICYFIFLKESPRNLILNAEESQGIDILETIKGGVISAEDRDDIISNVKGGINKNLDHSLISVFAPKLRKTTIIQSIIWFCFSYIFYGGIFSISLMLKDIGFTPENLIDKTMVVYGLSMPGNLVGGFLTEISYLGRLKTCTIGYGFLSFFIILLAFFPSYIEILIGFMGLFLNISFNVTCTYCSEYYPTRIRDTALGYLYFVTRISGFVSQIISFYLVSINFKIQYFFILFQTILCFILIFFLPEETHGKPLDVDYEEKKKVNI
jgi:putative MFS transporter